MSLLAGLPAGAACTRQIPSASRNTPLTAEIDRSESFSAAVVGEVNARRCQAGLPPVAHDPAATRSSTGQSLWMAEAGAMTHDSTRPGHRTLAARLAAEGISIRRKGYESIGALGFYSVAGLDCHVGRAIPTEAELAARIVQMWADSPAHRAQILSPEVQRAGAGAAVRLREPGCGTVYLTITLYG